MCPAELGGDASRRHISRGGGPAGVAVRCWHLEGGPTMYQLFHAPHGNSGPRAEGIHAKTETSLPRRDLSLLQPQQKWRKYSGLFGLKIFSLDHPDLASELSDTFVLRHPYSRAPIQPGMKRCSTTKNYILHLIDRPADELTKTPEGWLICFQTENLVSVYLVLPIIFTKVFKRRKC